MTIDKTAHLNPPKTAVILAGGLGTRLRGAIPDRPKVLAPAARKPFLEYLLIFLADQGVEDVILSIGYLGRQIRNFVKDGSRWGLNVKYSEETEPLGTGGALRLAFEILEEKSCFAMNGDTLFDINLRKFWQAHLQLSGLATIALREIDPFESAERGCVGLANNGRILSFDEKPDFSQSKDARNVYLSSGGVYILTKEALDPVPFGEKASIERDVFPRLVINASLYGILQHGYFADIGTPESLAKFESDLDQGIYKRQI